MLYTIFTVKDIDYKCRLNAKACVDLEKKLGGNPLNIFTEIKKTGNLPKVEDIILILYESMQQYHHGISLDEVYSIYDEYVDAGSTLTDLIPVIMQIFEVSGFFKSPKN